MPQSANQRIANMDGATALPRKSGELVFHDQWERRIFALAVALCERGLYTWDEFRNHLIAEIAAAEQKHETDPGHTTEPDYYESWLAAFEKLLAEKGIKI